MPRPVNVRLRWRRGAAVALVAASTGRARALGQQAAVAVIVTATITGTFHVAAANLDATSASEYAARTTDADRAAYLVSLLTAPVTVEIVDGALAVRASTTAAAPWASVNAGNVTPAPLPSGLTVTSGGVPDANWKLRFVGANGRIVQASFGVSSSSQQVRWSKTTFDAGTVASFSGLTLRPIVTPVNTALPSLTGTAQVGEIFSGSNGSWSSAVEELLYQHQRSANGTSGWSNITGAISATYLQVSADQGQYFRRGVAARNAAGTSAYAYSAPSAQIAAPAAQPLLTPADITYLGHYNLNVGAGDPYYGTCIALRYVGGVPRLIVSVFNGNGATTRPIREFSLAGVSFGGTISSAINTWNVDCTQNGFEPLWEGGATAQEPGYAGVESLTWDQQNGVLLRHHMAGYPGGFYSCWFDVLNVPNSGGAITRQKRVYIGDLNDSRINGGNSEIPASFRSEFGVGRWAMGTGGYRSLEEQIGGGAPLGFTTYAVPDLTPYADRATVPYTTLSSHSLATTLGRRSYSGYTFTPDGGSKTFTLAEVDGPGGRPSFAGVSVPTGTFSGQGPIDYYRAGGDPRDNPANEPIPTWDPSSVNGGAGLGTTWGETAPGMTRWANDDWYAGHAFLYGSGFTKRGVIAVGYTGVGRIWYSRSAVATERRRMEMHIFDPVHLGEVALGQRAATSIQPVSIRLMDAEWAPTGGLQKMLPSFAWDATTKRMYITQWVSGGIRILVYQVNA